MKDFENSHGTPQGTNEPSWNEVLGFIESTYETNGHVTLRDIMEAFNVTEATARKYMDRLFATGEWERGITRES